ncbi:growth factor receptor-bound protein 14-like isoform X2 [Lampetra fluviatilis]
MEISPTCDKVTEKVQPGKVALPRPYCKEDAGGMSSQPPRALLSVTSCFQPSPQHSSYGQPDDDVDLENLVNDMNTSESTGSASSSPADSVPLLQPCAGPDGRETPAHALPSIAAAAAASSAVTASRPGMSRVAPQPGDARELGDTSLLHQGVRRSQPVHIRAVRTPLDRRANEEEELQAASWPNIPNPFPELTSPAGSPVLTGTSLPPRQAGAKPQVAWSPGSWNRNGGLGTSPLLDVKVVKLFSEDGTSRSLEIPAGTSARDVCQSLILKNNCVDDNSWALIEHLPHLSLERTLEDHELVAQVQSTWGIDCDNKLFFRKNYAKYEFFKNPLQFFPEHMVSMPYESNGSIPHSQLIQNFMNSSSCPEIQGYLHVKEPGRKSWKKLYFFLRRSGLYFSTKGTSREPRHLQCYAELSDSGVYTVLSGRKMYGAPTDFGFCIKSNRASSAKELKLFCAEEEASRTCWITAMRLFKHSVQLFQNYRLLQQRRNHLGQLNVTPMRNISENTLVAMDFSGRKGRIIENPAEAQTVAVEEGQAWRRRGCQRLGVVGSPSPCQPSAMSIAIHKTQPWFHGRIPREEAHRIISQQGLVDGLFLLRDSQSNPRTFVLSLCHHQKIKHFQILLFEEDSKMFFSLDDGNTKFSDLIQLVEFYQLNRGILPCKLKHHCSHVVL